MTTFHLFLFLNLEDRSIFTDFFNSINDAKRKGIFLEICRSRIKFRHAIILIFIIDLSIIFGSNSSLRKEIDMLLHLFFFLSFMRLSFKYSNLQKYIIAIYHITCKRINRELWLTAMILNARPAIDNSFV